MEGMGVRGGGKGVRVEGNGSEGWRVMGVRGGGMGVRGGRNGCERWMETMILDLQKQLAGNYVTCGVS